MKPAWSLLALLSVCYSAHVAAALHFRDVSGKVRLRQSQRSLLKYGGPTVADFTGDGNLDLVLAYHGSAPLDFYTQRVRGKFQKTDFRLRRDIHGITPFRLPGVRDATFFALSPGGNGGTLPNPPQMFRVSRNGSIADVSTEFGVTRRKGRGRSSVVFSFRKRRVGAPDLLFLNGDSRKSSCPLCKGQYFVYEFLGANKTPMYRRRQLRGLRVTKSFSDISTTNVHAMAVGTDTNRMSLLMWRTLALYQVVGHFRVKDVSLQKLGSAAYMRGVSAVAEIDFDNDGDMDLYIARSKYWGARIKGNVLPDVLLENRGGVYVDVSSENTNVGIPQSTISQGVTVGDFNNDGWPDLYVTTYATRSDVVLLNTGQGSFRRLHPSKVPRRVGSGNNAVAVDFDQNGRIDVIRGEGEDGFGTKTMAFYGTGKFRVLRNNGAEKGKFVLVRVGGSRRGATSLYALVTVSWKDGKGGRRKTTRRVGPNGVQNAASMIETLHFGLGRVAGGVVRVNVRWLDGTRAQRRGVSVGSRIEVGSF